MRYWSFLSVPVAVVLVAGFAGEGSAQTAAGPEFQVNTYTTSAQRRPAVAARANGDFVVAWHSYGPDGNLYGIRAQRVAAGGEALGTEFQANSYTTNSQYWPRVASNARGAFVITWNSYLQDASAYAAVGQKFSATGVRVGAEFVANSYTPGYQYGVSPAVAADGSFVVAWDSFPFDPGPPGQDGSGSSVNARRFNTNGVATGVEFRVNSYTTGDQAYSAIAAAPGGSFVVAWQSPQDGSGFGIMARRFDSAGGALGAEFQVNVTTAGPQVVPSVAVNANGSFVVVWHSSDGSGYGIFGRRFDAAGVAVGAEFAVNTNTSGIQYTYGVTNDAEGNFVVSWASLTGDGSNYGVFGQRFTAAGARRGAEFRVNSFTTGVQYMPAAASDPVGNFLVAWTSEPDQDGDLGGVFGQRFGVLLPRSVAIDTIDGASSDGNGVWEPDETVDMRPTWRNASDASRTFTAALSGISSPPGPPAPTITDGSASYGTVANDTDAQCTDCYGVANTGPRPAVHWDITALESIAPDSLGQQKRWALHVGDSFTDVARSNIFYPFIEIMLHHAVTGGCAAGQYCPANTTTRQEMAVFVLAAKEGAGFAVPACVTPPFADVPTSSGFCPFIAELSRRGVVGGCGGGNYCPASPVTRQEMAIFALATLDPAFVPPACTTQPFNDVPTSSPFCAHIAELARRGVVGGCGGGNYCPAGLVTRQEMSVFIAGTFSLALYGI
jgi:hypothetical protein